MIAKMNTIAKSDGGAGGSDERDDDHDLLLLPMMVQKSCTGTNEATRTRPLYQVHSGGSGQPQQQQAG